MKGVLQRWHRSLSTHSGADNDEIMLLVIALFAGGKLIECRSRLYRLTKSLDDNAEEVLVDWKASAQFCRLPVAVWRTSLLD